MTSSSSSSSSSSPSSDRTIRAKPSAPIPINGGGTSQISQRSNTNSNALPSSPTISYARPPTPIPLRPAAPLALRQHPKLPHVPASSSYPSTRSLMRPTKFHHRAASSAPSDLAVSLSTLTNKATPKTTKVTATTTKITEAKSSSVPPPSSFSKRTARPAPLQLTHSHIHTRSRSEGNAKPCLDYATRALPPVPITPSAAADVLVITATREEPTPTPTPSLTSMPTPVPAPIPASPLPPPVPRKSRQYNLMGDTSRWFDSELELIFSGDEMVLHTPLMDLSSVEGSPRRIRGGRGGGGMSLPVDVSPSVTPEVRSEVPTEVPNTPCSAQFSTASVVSECTTISGVGRPSSPLLMSSSSSKKKTTVVTPKMTNMDGGLTKSLRWDEIAVFPEQQGLVNIHGSLKKLLDASSSTNTEIADLCKSLLRHLPQPGVASERKYTLKVQQEEQLERALRVLEASLIREDDLRAFEKALESLRQLVTVIRLRFATLPYHRDVQRLKAERAQLKEDRALVLVQIAIQEAEIKTAQLRREAERIRELEEAAVRRSKRREEKQKEKEVYSGYRRLLEERSEQLKAINEQIERENEGLMKVRAEREKQRKEEENAGARGGAEKERSVRDDAVLKRRREKVVFGGSVRIASVRDGIKCWI
ncbi:hypothetical protein FRB91_010162 [Serendipita sp. 411]|nr:hypothetical protein FRB91_010162 [Serendipita sp. 411]